MRSRTVCFALEEGHYLYRKREFAQKVVDQIRGQRRELFSGTFLYDFLDMIISRDLKILITTEQSRGSRSVQCQPGSVSGKAQRDRSFLMEMSIHYEQMIDFGEELEENENGFFQEENLRYFRLFTDRVTPDGPDQVSEGLYRPARTLLYQLDIRMNRIMTALTVITAVFMPLTLIVGWYGMNLPMPELDWKYSYPAVCVVCVFILTGGILLFKMKWL